MTTVTTGAIAAGSLFVTGFLLGMGFWASKKLTNVIDRKLLERDPDLLRQLYPQVPAPVQGI